MNTGRDFKDPEPVIYETEVDYLDRLDLLTEQEKKIPMDVLRGNSCNSFRRLGDALAPVDEIMRNLGF